MCVYIRHPFTSAEAQSNLNLVSYRVPTLPIDNFFRLGGLYSAGLDFPLCFSLWCSLWHIRMMLRQKARLSKSRYLKLYVIWSAATSLADSPALEYLIA